MLSILRKKDLSREISANPSFSGLSGLSDEENKNETDQNAKINSQGIRKGDPTEEAEAESKKPTFFVNP